MQQSGVYICQSTKNNRFYVGSADNIERRLIEHNRGKVKATRHIIPLVLKIFIPCSNSAEVRNAEYRLKRYKRRDVLERVIQNN